jgi:hypothetical protein
LKGFAKTAWQNARPFGPCLNKMLVIRKIAALLLLTAWTSWACAHIWTPPFCKLFRFDVSRSSYAVAPIYSAFGEILGDLWPRWISACFHPYQDTGLDDL